MRIQQRAGFTLVELMVAMTLTLFVMVILTQAFVTSLDTFSAMKGIGDMQQNLRTAGNVLRSDLSAYHFDGARRLSDISPAGNALIVKQPPQAGFFAVWQGSASVVEGTDANGVPSYRATNHILYMTVCRRGNRAQSFFSTPIQGAAADLNTFFSAKTAYDVDPTQQLPFATLTQPYTAGATTAFYTSQWAEVVYYLKRTGSTEEPNNPASVLGTPTFGLYRAQFVMVPDSTYVSAATYSANAAFSTFRGISCNTSPASAAQINFFSPSDAASYVAGQAPVVKRIIPVLPQFTPQAAAANAVTARVEAESDPTISTGAADTLLLPNVISFQIQVMPLVAPPGSGAFQDIANGGVFDTTFFTAPAGTNNNIFGLSGIQITLRVFDPSSRQARQMTIVQDL